MVVPTKLLTLSRIEQVDFVIMICYYYLINILPAHTMESLRPDIMLEILGWIGSVLFAVAAIPQAWKSYKDGNSDGLSTLFLWLWFWGEIFVLIYTIPKLLWPLLFNYIFNILLLFVILRYKYFPRKPVIDK